MRRFYWLLLICLLAGVAGPACHAQKQLVVLKKQKVRLRLYPGDEIVYRLKGSKTVHTSYINNLFDTAVMIHQEIIPYHKIDRIYFKQRNLLNVAGGFLVTGAVAYFVVDQVNETLVHHNDPNIDKSVARTSVAMIAVGLPLMLLHKNSQRIHGRYRVLTVEKGSAFYHPDIRGIQWIPNN